MDICPYGYMSLVKLQNSVCGGGWWSRGGGVGYIITI